MRRLAAAATALLLANVLATAPVAAATPQAITFVLQTKGTLEDSFSLTATADSGLPVSYARSTPATCSLTDDTLSLDALGTCTVTASQAGDASFDPAPDVTRSIEIVPASNATQTIDFTVPAAGVVGGSIELAASTSSGLEVAFASATPAVCSVSDTTAKLEILGTCAIVASQSGNDIWLPAAEVRAEILIELSPVATGVNLGRLALNGPVMSSVIDPASGITYIVGPFTEVGVRTGAVAFVDPPSTGQDDVAAATPDVVGNQVAVLPDDESGFFLAGNVDSIDGDGVRRWGVTRMTVDGGVDHSWSVHDPCSIGALPRWSVSDWLVVPHEASDDAKGYSTMGLQMIDKATGRATASGAGTSSCAASGRRWSSVGPWAPLVACKTWEVCTGVPTDVVLDGPSQTLIVEMMVVAGQTAATAVPSHYLVAYDLAAGTRMWTRALQDPSQVQSGQVMAMTAFGGSVLVVGDLRLDAGSGTAATMALLDARTGSILQRWSSAGEQSLSDPTSLVAPAAACTPAHDGLQDYLRFDFVPLDDSRVVGYGRTTATGQVRDIPVCEYGLIGAGAAARLASTQRGVLPVHADRDGRAWLPSALMSDRFLVGGFDSFDLVTDVSVSDWHPSPSVGIDLTVVAVGDAVVLGGPFTFLHGAGVNYALALDQELDPIDTFHAEIGSYDGNAPWVRAATIAGGYLIVVGILGQSGNCGPAVALDLATGARVWGDVTDHVADALTVTPTTDGSGFYVGGEWLGDGSAELVRYLPSGGGFARDLTWEPSLDPLRGNASAATGVVTIGDRIYVGGTFSGVDGSPRQGLARFDADGSLDAWAPKLVDELKIPTSATPELYPRAFLEAGDKVVIAGTFRWIMPDGVTPSASVVMAYNASTGARVKPTGTNAPWFPMGHYWGAYDIDRLGDTIYVAMGNSGVGAFDASSLAYLPHRSIRYAMPTDGMVYAIEVRAPSGERRVQSVSGAQATLSTDALVVGGSIAQFDDRSASNILEVSVDMAPPLVIKRAPAKASTGVRRNTNITVTFSERVTGATKGVYLVDTKSNKRVPAKTSYDSKTRTVKINPDARLAAGRLFKVKVRSSVKDAVGNAIAAVSWTFRVSTDATRPRIVQRRPTSGQSGVSRTANVVVKFSEVVSVSATRIRLRDAATSRYVTARVTLASDGKTATLDPTKKLKSSHRYTVVVKGVLDRAGNSVKTTSWSFTTRR